MMFEDLPGKFEAFMAEHADKIKTPEDEAHLKTQFIREYNEMNEKRRMQGPVTAEDYLELAAQATTKKKQREYLAEALGLEPENLEAKLQMLMLDAKNPLEAAAQMEQLVAEGTEQMRKAGYLKNDVGEFWLVWETRPYMRLLGNYAALLVFCGRYRKAMDTAREMLRLCRSDNLGIRYTLMALYAALEEEKPARRLFLKYECEESAEFLLPLSILYFKLGNLDLAEQYLRQMQREYSSTKRLFNAVRNGSIEELEEYAMNGGPGACDDFTGLVSLYYEIDFLTLPNGLYFEWGGKLLNRRKQPAKG